MMAHSHGGVSGMISRIGRGASSATRFSTASVPFARNGGRPAAIWYSTLPRLNRSARWSSVSPLACSGARGRARGGARGAAGGGGRGSGGAPLPRHDAVQHVVERPEHDAEPALAEHLEHLVMPDPAQRIGAAGRGQEPQRHLVGGTGAA